MAGGPNAAVIPCDTCLAAGRRVPATRTYDGSETDYYACPEGHTFGIYWRELPTEPMWSDPDRTPEPLE